MFLSLLLGDRSPCHSGYTFLRKGQRYHTGPYVRLFFIQSSPGLVKCTRVVETCPKGTGYQIVGFDEKKITKKIAFGSFLECSLMEVRFPSFSVTFCSPFFLLWCKWAPLEVSKLPPARQDTSGYVRIRQDTSGYVQLFFLQEDWLFVIDLKIKRELIVTIQGEHWFWSKLFTGKSFAHY